MCLTYITEYFKHTQNMNTFKNLLDKESAMMNMFYEFDD